jgi:predicted acetyltransferase
VTVSIRDAQNSPQDRTWIQGQYPEYLEDLSQQSMNTGMFPAKGEYGERQQELMARWFADETSHPLIILKNDKPAGFALVSRPPRHQRQEVDFRMADFFITPRSRRLGIGRDAAALIFNRFAGTWEIVEFVYNKPAVQFWRAIVGAYTGGKFKERVSQGEVHQVFAPAPAADTSPCNSSRSPRSLPACPSRRACRRRRRLPAPGR